jgi:hypothetical protein
MGSYVNIWSCQLQQRHTVRPIICVQAFSATSSHKYVHLIWLRLSIGWLTDCQWMHCLRPHTGIIGSSLVTVICFQGARALIGPGPLHCCGLKITLRHTTPGRTLDECSAQRRDLYLTTHNTHKRQTSMPSARWKPTIPASERPQTHALDRAATGIGTCVLLYTGLITTLH